MLTEPDLGMAARLRDRAPDGAEVVESGAEALPFDDGSFDVVVSTMVLCTVPDVEAVIREIRRALAPGGELRFVEHVRAESGVLPRVQDVLRKPWEVAAAGCRCNQSTLSLLRGAGFSVRCESDRWAGMPAIVGPLEIGSATVAV